VKPLKFIVLALALLGLVACFLPFISMPGFSSSLWDGHKGADGAQIYLTMAGFVLVVAMAVIGILKGFRREQAIASMLGFAFVLVKIRDVFLQLLDFAIGAKLIFIAIVGGILVSAIALWKPEQTS
jgi:hypothetical protein